MELNEDDINRELALRAPGRTPYTSSRKESDHAEILSGVFEGKTTGAPISIIIPNKDVDSSKYDPIKNILRPGHATDTYLKKYGVFDYRGGGRASARETACRVASGAIAKKVLQQSKIRFLTYIKELGGIQANVNEPTPDLIRQSPIFCPDPVATQKMIKKIEEARAEGDSLGGVVELCVENMPVGLGDPVYEKIDATLASAMMSIPATKAFEIGSGIQAARMKGSEHNDCYSCTGKTVTNRAGGVIGGITNGMPLVARVTFKPTSSIGKPQQSVDLEGNPTTFQLPPGSRHDPCVAIRAVPVVEAMTALVIADALLRGSR